MVSTWSIGGKTVQSLVINNKEVQSIVRVSDGAVLYQKAQTHSYALAFSSATYQTDSNGDVTVYVTLTDNGVPVSGETVNFSDATSVYTGITNNLGVATCTLNYLSNGTVSASYSNASASANVVSNYQPPSVTLTEPITYSLVTNQGWLDVVLCPCEYVGDPVNTIQGLYNPPMTADELWAWWFDEFNEEGYVFAVTDGEVIQEATGDVICYAVATNDGGMTFLNVEYSTTDGTDITITVSDN